MAAELLRVLIGIMMAAVTAMFCPLSLREDGTGGDTLCSGFIEQRRTIYGSRTYSSKTGYNFTGHISDETFYEGCNAVKIYLLVRHGSRMPKEKQIVSFNSILSNIKKTSGDIDLKEWKNPFPTDEASDLSVPGMKELYCLAGRFHKRFPDLFKSNYSSAYSFESTYKTRASTSALSFAEYLFHNSGPLNGYQPIQLTVNPPDDKILRFFDNCPIYTAMVKDNETLANFINQFLNTDSFTSVQKRLQDSVDHSRQSWNLTITDVLTMYLICTMETANFMESKWCNVFSQTDLDILEYFDDLKSYWIKGYGFPVNINISCLLYDDIYQSLLSDDNDNTVTFLRFAHSETIIPLVAALGLFKDEEPLSPLTYNGKRKFRVASITPFTGNIAFIVYQCKRQLYVRILVNEQDIDLQHSLCIHGTKKNFCLLDQLQKIVTDLSENILKFPCQFCVK